MRAARRPRARGLLEVVGVAVLDALRRREGFTDVERSLADYILAHADDVSRMSIAELAEGAHASKASIVRLCRKLGLDGYRLFGVELSSDLERHRLVREDIDIDHPFLAGDDRQSVLSAVAGVMKDAIDATYELLRPADVERAARAMRRARHVLLYGIGDSQVNCQAFANLMLKLGIPCVVADKEDDRLYAELVAVPGDVALFVSYSGDLMDRPLMRETLATLKRRGAVAVLVSSGAAPAGVDVCLRLPTGEDRRAKIATYYSQACIRFTLNCLHAAVYALDYEGSAQMVEGAGER